jgi:hypothetical protein
MMITIKGPASALLLGAMMLLGIGCAPSCRHIPDRHEVTVSLSPDLKAHLSAIEVHIFAANRADSAIWEKENMTSYWSSGSPDRKRNEGKMYIMHFDAEHPEAQTFSPAETKASGETKKTWNDLWPIWEKDRAVNLLIFTTLGSDAPPGSDANTAFDPRRLIIPLDRCRWEKPQQPLEVTLTPTRIELSTLPLEKSK